MEDTGGKEIGEQEAMTSVDIPDHKTQKQEIHAVLSQRLEKGDTWYLVDVKWMKQWKKYVGYVGYDHWDQSAAGLASTNPGPIDNSILFKNRQSEALKDHLMEELDYSLMPESAWHKLYAWYGLSEGSNPIARNVVEHRHYMKYCKVEVYLLEFKLCIHPKTSETVSKMFSRADTIAIVETELRQTFEVPEETKCRVWHRYMTSTYELLSKRNQTLQDVGLYSGQIIVLEKKNDDGSWPRATEVTGHVTRSTDRIKGESGKSGSSRSSQKVGNSYYSWYDKPTTPGLRCLSNLGNTCFMNSALQCLSNTQPLTEYFTGPEGTYKKRINKGPPMGIAESYGEVLEQLWSGNNGCVAPRNLKTQVCRLAAQFTGNGPHDSQEFLAFLLDALHKDLMTCSTMGQDSAAKTWHKGVAMSQSVIVNMFQGQLMSTLVCSQCNKVTRTFDPFMTLSLPLRPSSRFLTVSMVRANPMEVIYQYKVEVPKRGQVITLKESLGRLTGVDPTLMVVVDVYNHRFHRIFRSDESISHIMDRDDIFVYELAYPLEDKDWVHVPVYHREEVVRDVRYTYQSYTQRYHHLFGHPVIVPVPRQNCTYRDLYTAITRMCGGYIKMRETDMDLFQLVVVNSYGNQEVQKLRDNDQTLKLSSQTYIACDWTSEVKESCYDVEKSEDVQEHASCHASMQLQLFESLQQYTNRIGQEETWYCSQCKVSVKASQKFDLWRLPEILVIHLKRFSSEGGQRSKLNVMVNFPVNGLNLSQFVEDSGGPKLVYDLFAVCNNHFDGGRIGHYTAYCKHKDTRKWYNFNDDHISEITEHQVVTSAAYLLFYRRSTQPEKKPCAVDEVRAKAEPAPVPGVLLSGKSGDIPGTIAQLQLEKRQLEENLVQQTEEKQQLLAEAEERAVEAEQRAGVAQQEKKLMEAQFQTEVERSRDFQRQVSQLQQERERAIQTEGTLREQVSQLQEQRELTGHREQALREEVGQLQGQREEAVQTEQTLREQVNQLQEHKEQAIRSERELQAQFDRLQEEKARAEHLERTVQAQVRQLQQQRDQAVRRERTQFDQLQEQREQAVQMEQTLQEQVDNLQEQREQATRLDQQHRDQISRLQVEVGQLQLSLRQQASSREIEFWKVPRQSVQILGEIDTGAWGCVAKGIFRGQEVAVKWPHRAILEEHVVGRLKREVRMMAHVRHPNLLLFIAAVFDELADRLQEPPLIVTELLDMNLRSAYRNGRLDSSVKLPIFRDVACALNYLHQHQEPIIHRDVSAPNVLVEALPNNKWRAKLSDFGSANLARLAHTAAEGAILYAAPETFPVHDPSALAPPQTTKIDVYSYGVLLCEVHTNRIPFQEEYRRMLQEVQRQSLFLYNLIISCTRQKAEERPAMSVVLIELSTKMAESQPAHRHN